MAFYNYKAVGRDGKATSGAIEADTRLAASRELRSRGLTLLALETGDAADVKGDIGRTPKRDEILAFTSELSVLLRAGLPLDRSLKVLIDMASQAHMQSLQQELLKAVKGGKALSQALEPHAELFGTFYISMVRAGEASGQLSAVLERLVEYLENAKAARESVVSALIYPSILLFVAVLSIVGMLGFVVPQFQSLFNDMGEALPALTRMVIAAADFVKGYFWLLLIVVVGSVWWFRRWSASAQGRSSLDRRMLNLPLVGGIVFEFEVSKFARTVGTLLDNGVPLLGAINIAIETVDNEIIRDSLQVLPPAVKAGKRMSVALESTGEFSPMVIQMVRVGEESGSLGEMMSELARVFDEHVQAGVKRLLTLLEPVLILTMGFVIAFIIIAILMGILSVNDLAV